MDFKLGILLNDEVNDVIGNLAKRMGTSKRNVISLALVHILKDEISKNKLNKIKEDVKNLNHATNITVNEQFKKRLESIDRYGLSIRTFFGYLICDYFYKNYSYFLGNETLENSVNIKDSPKENLQFRLDKTIKSKISTYCNENSIAISSLFAHYIMNKEIHVNEFISEHKEEINLTLSKSVKNKFYNTADKMNVSYVYYLNLIAQQICIDADL